MTESETSKEASCSMEHELKVFCSRISIAFHSWDGEGSEEGDVQSKRQVCLATSTEEEAKLLMSLMGSSCAENDRVSSDESVCEVEDFCFSCPGLSLDLEEQLIEVTPQECLSKALECTSEGEVPLMAKTILRNAGHTFSFAAKSILTSWTRSLSKVIDLRSRSQTPTISSESPSSSEDERDSIKKEACQAIIMMTSPQPKKFSTHNKEQTLLRALTQVQSSLAIVILNSCFQVLPPLPIEKKIKLCHTNSITRPIEFEVHLLATLRNQNRQIPITVQAPGTITASFSKQQKLTRVGIQLDIHALFLSIQRSAREAIRKATEYQILLPHPSLPPPSSSLTLLKRNPIPTPIHTDTINDNEFKNCDKTTPKSSVLISPQPTFSFNRTPKPTSFPPTISLPLVSPPTTNTYLDASALLPNNNTKDLDEICTTSQELFNLKRKSPNGSGPALPLVEAACASSVIRAT